MGLLKDRSDKEPDRDIRQIGLLAAVPSLLLVAPLIGYLGGWWLDGKLGTEPYLSVIGIFMGIAAAGLEIYQLVKKASSKENKSDDGNETRT